MKAISYTALRNSLAKAMDDVNRDHEPVIITRQKGEPAVLMSLADFSAWQETAYLLRSPENARRLREAISQLEAGRGRVRKLIK